MSSERLLAFTDGVIAVIITIMVLEMKPPARADIASLTRLWPVFLAYVISFTYVAIYWNNHHHFFKLAPEVDGAVMWANLLLLFWLSLIPFTTAWMGAHPFAAWPTAIYGASLLASALAFLAMQTAIIRLQGPGSRLKAAIGGDFKGKSSPVFYAAGMVLAFVAPALAYLLYAAVAVMWLIPDRRVAEVVRSG